MYYTTFEYPVHIFFHVEEQRKPYNFMELKQNWLRMCKQSIPGCFSPPTRPGYKASIVHARLSSSQYIDNVLEITVGLLPMHIIIELL